MSEKNFCFSCGDEISECNIHIFNDNVYCESCFEDVSCICSACGRRISTEENEGDENICLCSRCFDFNYTHCEECGRLLHRGDAFYEDDDSDLPYCSGCYNQNDITLHDYNYKPEPIFYGDGNRYFGVELEIDVGGKLSSNASKLIDVGNELRENIYIKSDGSLDDGIEIVTHPMTLEYHKKKMPWLNLVNTAVELGYKSHKTTTCGLHIHINRNTFSDETEIQEEAIGKVLFLVERFWNELLKFSRRTQRQVEQWANRYGYKDKPKEIFECAKKDYGRYKCVNLSNYYTIEFRIFRGTLKYETLIATLQLVNEICNVAIFMSDKELDLLSWSEFVSRLNENENPELINYLKERRLYINENIESVEEE